jgi:hypothetical protein
MKTKKRNKAHKSGRLTIPMMFLTSTVLAKYPHLATSLYGQIIAFCERPCIETSNNLSRQFACIAGGMSHMNKGAPIRGKRDAASIAICSAINCIEAICHRFERTGAILVNELEKTTLHAAAGRLDEVLQTMPLACYLRAEQEADFWLKEADDPRAMEIAA